MDKFYTKKIVEIGEKLSNIEGKIDGMNKQLSSTCYTLKNHDKRINKTESFCDNMEGKMGVIGTLAGLLGSIAVAVVNYFFRRLG